MRIHAFLIVLSVLCLSGCKFLKADSTWDKIHEVCAADLFSAPEIAKAAEARKISVSDVADIVCSSAFVLEPYIRAQTSSLKGVARDEALRIAKERGLI